MEKSGTPKSMACKMREPLEKVNDHIKINNFISRKELLQNAHSEQAYNTFTHAQNVHTPESSHEKKSPHFNE